MTWRAISAMPYALAALAPLASCPTGRERLVAHEDFLLNLALTERAAAEAPVMAALRQLR
jgi:hypothetical protein